jgi:hypothetical protein
VSAAGGQFRYPPCFCLAGFLAIRGDARPRLKVGALDWIRTSDLQLRRLPLYPTELRARPVHFTAHSPLPQNDWGYRGGERIGCGPHRARPLWPLVRAGCRSTFPLSLSDTACHGPHLRNHAADELLAADRQGGPVVFAAQGVSGYARKSCRPPWRMSVSVMCSSARSLALATCYCGVSSSVRGHRRC